MVQTDLGIQIISTSGIIYIIKSLDAFKCYHWTEADKQQLPKIGPQRVCLNKGFVWARGIEALAPGCQKCGCCQPSKPYLIIIKQGGI